MPCPELKAYHPDVKVYEVQRDGRPVAIFLHDNFARSTKRSGAWMSAYRWQSRIDGEVIPIIVNNNNFAKAPVGEPTLLSLDDVRTLFHEFGHGLHGMLSDVTYERLSGTKVLRDFVELPSQLFEHWMLEPAVLKKHARHVRTGEPIPDDLIDRIKRARRFNQGFETVGYAACALLDMALHARTDVDGVDISEFERIELQKMGMPPGTYAYHRLPHFQHLFASGYAAGYYVYMWAEVLDAVGRQHYNVVALTIGKSEGIPLAEKTYMGTPGYVVEVHTITLEAQQDKGSDIKKGMRLTFSNARIRMRQDSEN